MKYHRTLLLVITIYLFCHTQSDGYHCVDVEYSKGHIYQNTTDDYSGLCWIHQKQSSSFELSDLLLLMEIPLDQIHYSMSKLNLKFHNSTIWHNTKDCTSLQWLDDKNEIGIIINCRNDIKNGQVIVTETKSKYVDEIFESIISNGYEKISENLDEKGMIYEYLIEKYIVRCSFIRSGRLNVNSIIVFHK